MAVMFPGSVSHYYVWADLKWIVYENNLRTSQALQTKIQAVTVEITEVKYEMLQNFLHV
jgi:hypothetical protein